MYFCENCIINECKYCMNKHPYYNGIICTCRCNWETKGDKSQLNLTDDEYLFLANCSDNEFHNWCIRWLTKGDKSQKMNVDELLEPQYYGNRVKIDCWLKRWEYDELKRLVTNRGKRN